MIRKAALRIFLFMLFCLLPFCPAAGVKAEVDVCHTDMHAFDMLRDGDLSREAADKFERHFEYALAHYASSGERIAWSGSGIS